MGPASARTEGGEAARGNDFVLVGDDGRAELATAWVRSCGGLQAAKLRQRVMRSERSVSSLRGDVGSAIGLLRAPNRSNLDSCRAVEPPRKQ